MKLFFVIATLLFWIVPNTNAQAAIEMSIGGSFKLSHYNSESYTWSRTYGASFGVYLTELTEIELGFQDSVERNFIVGVEDTTFYDQIYSASVSQTLMSKSSPVQPYVKIGMGQLNRNAVGNYTGGGSPPIQHDSLTGIIGGGVKIYLSKSLGLRGEATSYLPWGSDAALMDNFSTTVGISLYL